MIVVDASVVVTALVDAGPDGDRARARLGRDRLLAPEVVDLEVLSVIRRRCAAGLLDVARAEQALDDLLALPIERAPHRPLLPRCWELRHNLTVYDAAYVALAEILGAVVVTGDQGLELAPGIRCPIEVVSTTGGAGTGG